MTANRIKNVAIVGASGQQGTHIVKALLATNKFNISALTRADSKSAMPDGVTVKTVDYEKTETLVQALTGQDVLIVTMNVMAPKDTESKLIRAAAEAKVPWVIPNEWGMGANDKDPVLSKETLIGEHKREHRDLIEKLAVSSWIGFGCGHWYVYSLGNGYLTYGFEFPTKTVTFIDDGEAKINTSNQETVGQAVTALLSLPVEPESGYSGKTVSDYKNTMVRISSFLVSQRDMLDSVLRVTGDKESDWTIKHENSKERYEAGVKAMKSGDRTGFGKAMYTRVFYPDGSGNYGDRYGLDNDVLGLPKEDLDASTRAAIEYSKTSMWGRAK